MGYLIKPIDMSKEAIEKARMDAIRAALKIGISDFEKAVDNAIKKRQEWELAKARLYLALKGIPVIVAKGVNPGDVIAGIAARTFLNAVSPALLKKMDKIGIAPGKYS